MIKVLLILSALFGIGAAALGFMTKGKVDSLKDDLSGTKTRLVDTQADLDKTKGTLKTTQDSLAATTTELEAKKAEAVKLSADLSDANKKVDDLNSQIATHTARIEELNAEIEKYKLAATPAGGGEPIDANVLKQQIDDLTKQRDAAEAEKALLVEQANSARAQLEKLQVAEQQRKDKIMARGLTGRILAVNHAYNFVVLNLGDRQGVVEGGEMIIRRQNGDMIGRLKISSVEPSQSIGDIILSSVPRGFQVQPGDLVIYPGAR